MNPLIYAIRGSNQIGRNGRDVNGRSAKKCSCKSHDTWSHSSLYQVLSLKKKKLQKRYVAVCYHNFLFGMILQDHYFYLYAIFVNVLWFFKENQSADIINY